jgi:hypothetical protein
MESDGLSIEDVGLQLLEVFEGGGVLRHQIALMHHEEQLGRRQRSTVRDHHDQPRAQQNHTIL